jgi:hypothetical protein
MAVTLAQLVDEAQTLFDVSGSQAFTQAQWERMVNEGNRALWADVTAANKYFRVTRDSFTIAAQTRALPAGYQETVNVIRNPGTETEDYLNKLGPRNGSRGWTRTYRLQGTSLYIEPIGNAAGTYAHDYIPAVVDLTAIINMDVELEQWRLYPVYYTVLQAIGHDNTDGNAFFRLLYGVPGTPNEPGLRGQVMKWAAGKRSADPDTIEDVRGRRGRFLGTG